MNAQDTRAPWIFAGYSMFAKHGPGSLKVEALARKAGISKSSFYHHFGDIDVFIEGLLEYHLTRARVIAERERKCRNVDPELLRVLIDVKEDLLFNRQLRVNRDVPEFKTCFEQASGETGNAIMKIWAEAIGLSHDMGSAELILALTLENFFLQITEQTLNYEWLSNYVKGIRSMVMRFVQVRVGD
jgi:AcrR family transcriptional regulator